MWRDFSCHQREIGNRPTGKGRFTLGIMTQSKKIERDTARACQRCEYLTLLNTWSMLINVFYKLLTPKHVGNLTTPPPNPPNIHETKLYGR